MILKQILKKYIKKSNHIYYFYLYIVYKKRVKKFDRMTIDDKKEYIDNLYIKKFSRNINWQNPTCYTEKIQYLKLSNNNNELYAKLADKYEVREWVRDKIGDKYLIPLIGVYDAFEEIDYDLLPNQFVIKCNHDSGSVTVVKNKNKKEWKKLKYKYDYHLKTDFSKFTFESHYSLIKPKIIIEELIGDGNIQDYKFLCFNGKPFYCWVDSDRFINHMRNTYDLQWSLQPWTMSNYNNNPNLKKPENFEEMSELALLLCKGFPAIRVDFYNINGKIYFGELTFTSESGFGYLDEKTDKMLGQLWENTSELQMY